MYAMEDFCQLSNRVTADKYKGSYEGCGKIIDRYSKNVGVDKAEFFAGGVHEGDVQVRSDELENHSREAGAAAHDAEA